MVATNLTSLFSTLITGLHILDYNSVLDAYGHMSVRNPNNASNFFMSRNLAPALVANSSDLVEYYVSDAAPLDPNAPDGFIERYIHSEIYKLWPNVSSVVHSHSPQVIPYSISGVELRPAIHMAGFLGASISNFNITKYYEPGDNQDFLVRNQRLGAEFASYFSTNPNSTSNTNNTVNPSLDTGTDYAVSLMQNHGFTTVAPSIELAVMQAIYTQTNAGIQTTALTLHGVMPGGNGGHGVQYQTDQQTVQSWMTMTGTADRPWGLWSHQVRSSSLYQNLLDPNQTKAASPLL